MEPTEDDPTLAALASLLAVQASRLHRLFMRTFADILSNKVRSDRDVSRALRAQAQSRAALLLLRALRAAQSEKSRNRNERTIGREKSPA